MQAAELLLVSPLEETAAEHKSWRGQMTVVVIRLPQRFHNVDVVDVLVELQLAALGDRKELLQDGLHCMGATSSKRTR